MVLPDVLVARRVDDGLPDHAETVLHLGGGRRRLAMELEREPAHVAHEAVEDLIHEAIVDRVETRVLQHELGVDDEHEDLAERHQEIEVAALRVVRRGLGHERTERGDLLDEERDVRRLVGGEHRRVVVEGDLPEPTRGALVEEEIVVRGLVAPPHWRVGRVIQEVPGDELHDEGNVHVHRALELR